MFVVLWSALSAWQFWFGFLAGAVALLVFLIMSKRIKLGQ